LVPPESVGAITHCRTLAPPDKACWSQTRRAMRQHARHREPSTSGHEGRFFKRSLSALQVTAVMAMVELRCGTRDLASAYPARNASVG
jgi:hypothetical protein